MPDIQEEFVEICRVVLLNMRSSKIELRRVMETKYVGQVEMTRETVEELIDVLVKVGFLEKLTKKKSWKLVSRDANNIYFRDICVVSTRGNGYDE
jgi:hypothetical protein